MPRREDQRRTLGLRFVGRIVYDRPTTLDMNNNPVSTTEEGVDGIWVEVMDEDGIDSETIWSGTTDPNGYFDTGAISWDDCDFTGCDVPDIYVRFETDSGVVNVQDGEDILVMTDCETGPNLPGPPPGCTAQQFAAADYGDDGDVDMDDFGRFQRCIAGPGQIPPANCEN